MQTIKKAFLMLQIASKVEKIPMLGFDHINIAARSAIAEQAGVRHFASNLAGHKIHAFTSFDFPPVNHRHFDLRKMIVQKSLLLFFPLRFENVNTLFSAGSYSAEPTNRQAQG